MRSQALVADLRRDEAKRRYELQFWNGCSVWLLALSDWLSTISTRITMHFAFTQNRQSHLVSGASAHLQNSYIVRKRKRYISQSVPFGQRGTRSQLDSHEVGDIEECSQNLVLGEITIIWPKFSAKLQAQGDSHFQILSWRSLLPQSKSGNHDVFILIKHCFRRSFGCYF